ISPRHLLLSNLPHIDSLGRPICPLHQLHRVELGNLISKASTLYLSLPSPVSRAHIGSGASGHPYYFNVNSHLPSGVNTARAIMTSDADIPAVSAYVPQVWRKLDDMAPADFMDLISNR
ncbi:hypothetical protein LCGC14_2224260, partial [marine sediment metagenome]